jgi:hypothetical protein
LRKVKAFFFRNCANAQLLIGSGRQTQDFRAVAKAEQLKSRDADLFD